MTNNRDRLNEQITQGFSELTPDLWADIKSALPEAPAKESVPITRTRSYSKKRLIPVITAAAAIVLLVFSFVIVNGMDRVVSELFIDVNPSVCVSLNKAGKVVKVEGVNTDGVSVVEAVSAEYGKTKDLNETVERIVAEIDKEGYFSDGTADVLVTLCYSGKENEETLSLAGSAVEKYAESHDLNAELTVKSFVKDTAREEKAKELGISAGKYEYITSMVESDQANAGEIDALAEMSTKEISKYAAEKKESKAQESDNSGQKDKSGNKADEDPDKDNNDKAKDSEEPSAASPDDSADEPDSSADDTDIDDSNNNNSSENKNKDKSNNGNNGNNKSNNGNKNKDKPKKNNSSKKSNSGKKSGKSGKKGN